MIVYKDYIVFTILGQEVNLISSDTVYGQSTVAEIDNHYYYLGIESPTLGAAVMAWHDLHQRDLTNEELDQIISDNKSIPDEI